MENITKLGLQNLTQNRSQNNILTDLAYLSAYKIQKFKTEMHQEVDVIDDLKRLGLFRI